MDGATEVNGEKISVIVPVYRVEPYLRRCLDSIVNQTHRNLEIILVDDGSPDSCGAICDEYAAKDDRIMVVHQENGGVSSARNAGLDIAKGDWLGFVDPDDWVEEDMFQYLLEGALHCHADIAICGVRGTGAYVSSTFWQEGERELGREQALREFIENKMLPSCCDKLTRQTLWKGVRFSNLKIGEDFLTIGRLLGRVGTVVCLPEVKYNYRARPESALTSNALEGRLDCWRAANGLYEELSPQWPQLRHVLAGRSAAAAIGVWGTYLNERKDRRRDMFLEIEQIAVFCRSHYQDALCHVNLGVMGRIALKMTPYPTWWAFLIAWMASGLYQIKHKRPL